MSRIDDNSDNQRIREMQETELRNRVDREKRDNEARVTRSFGEVMREKAQQSKDKQATTRDQAKKGAEQGQKGKTAAQSLLSKLPKNAQELSKRAAMSQALHSNLAKTRRSDADSARQADSAKSEELMIKGDEEKERIEKGEREEAEKETLRTEEREAEHKKLVQEHKGEGEGRTEERRERNQHGRKDQQDERKAEGVQAAAQPQGSAPPRIPQELIDRIVSAIHTAHLADGRTEMHIDLKGSMLEGVRLKVSAKGGKVSCVFEGCDKDTRNLLESTKGALMRGLAKRGMTLVSLTAK